ncbi:thioredoxin family protein [Paenibacillus contaminans]|uniref:Thiol reductase thioredoxin n=1 Tax=Paenibacillus contaminans TaxID=450362 RepID=A0A329MLX7_9BACL|nr:thioredoxin family protein [Paenibacillus contaminans]RAV20610.1 thiol reductase thioredoxin [Paenibacillus contaminans]
MRDIDEKDLLLREQDEGLRYAVFAYTPLCGTCKLASRMLGIVEQMLPDLELVQCNVNYAPKWVRAQEITSVPCLILYDKGSETERAYSMKSVDELYMMLKPLGEKR